MPESKRISNRISSLCVGFINSRYTRSKILTDPLYGGVYRELEFSKLPLLDIGCGLGILAMYLRERGWMNPVSGFDYDGEKIRNGEVMIARGGYADISLQQGDARTGLPDHRGDVTILDIMQFFNEDEQTALLSEASKRVAPNGRLIIRSGLKDRNARFFVTWLVDVFAKCMLWMKAAPIHYPRAEFFQRVLEDQGLKVEIRPFWGGTPFNNYMILASRPE